MLRPVNRHILVKYSPPQESQTHDFVADDYKPPTDDYVVVDVLAISDDVSIRCATSDKIVIDKRCCNK